MLCLQTITQHCGKVKCQNAKSKELSHGLQGTEETYLQHNYTANRGAGAGAGKAEEKVGKEVGSVEKGAGEAVVKVEVGKGVGLVENGAGEAAGWVAEAVEEEVDLVEKGAGKAAGWVAEANSEEVVRWVAEVAPEKVEVLG